MSEAGKAYARIHHLMVRMEHTEPNSVERVNDWTSMWDCLDALSLVVPKDEYESFLDLLDHEMGAFTDEGTR